ncbi:MAG: two-component sensor histidine kinase, partial [Rhizobiales bacterium]|nr:two-component sensor histidine kinase [Hyphomicrobiales bacterium]
MNRLRLRLALLVVVAIVAVVGLATLAAIAVIGRPGQDRLISDAAAQINVVSRLAAQLPEQFDPGSQASAELGVHLMHGPAPGPVDPRLTESIKEQLARL